MTYEPYSQKKKGNYVFYIIIIIALLLIAVVAWIGLSNMSDPAADPDTSMNETPNLDDDNSQEYESNDSSYNDNSIPSKPDDIISEVMPSTPTDDTVKDEPYTKSYTMPINGEILKDFSADTLQFSQTFGDMRLHAAVDIACKEGTFISALTDGKVLSVEESAALGNVITIDHGDGLIVKYACVKDSKVKAGATVKSGDLIGKVGTIPNESSDQPHLHIEATKTNKPISILDFFK
ncbi:MAG: M23 family metallopeptidase [Ruminococcaceae bacterium]|nr:M23 family metallopeptidase [Oscillospiraceae bacterium]